MHLSTTITKIYNQIAIHHIFFSFRTTTFGITNQELYFCIFWYLKVKSNGRNIKIYVIMKKYEAEN